MPISIDLFDSANQKFDPSGTSLTSTDAEAAIKEVDAKTGGSGVPEAPDDANRTHFREGTTPSWTKSLKGYGEVEQISGTSGALTLEVGDGNRIYTNATGAVTGITLTANITVMDCTWILQHNGENVTFPASFKFAGGTTPSPSSGNAWLMGLFTRDGGTNWVVSYVEDFTL